MLHHPDKIKNPAKMHLSYAPFGTLNLVGLNRQDPASRAFRRLRELPLNTPDCHATDDQSYPSDPELAEGEGEESPHLSYGFTC